MRRLAIVIIPIAALCLLGIDGEGCGEDLVNDALEDLEKSRCGPTNAATTCGDIVCAFDPTNDVDCATACANIATVCASGCAAQCNGLSTDTTTCEAACNSSKDKSCTNVTFGCYATSNDCSAVGTCVSSNLEL